MSIYIGKVFDFTIGKVFDSVENIKHLILIFMGILYYLHGKIIFHEVFESI